MTTQAKQAANIANAQASTGPRSDEGKATSSKNATKLGLFTQTDFIRPGEEDLYQQSKANLANSLSPQTPLEETLAEEIHRSVWRLRRCSEVEGSFICTTENDPMQNEATAKLQLSVDRARSLSHRLLHKCTAELRKLQTDRFYLSKSMEDGTDLSQFGLADVRAIEKGLDNQIRARLRKRELTEREDFDTHCGTVQTAEEKLRQQNAASTAATPVPASPAPAAKVPETKRTQTTAVTQPEIARNAPCPCKSGQKYKRCCGKDAPPLLCAA